jgi:endoglucanase
MDTTPYSTLRLIVTASLITVVGCNSAGTDPQVTPTTAAMESKPVLAVSDMIKLNQVGYPNDAEKMALIPNSDATRFNVVNTATGEVAYSDTLSESFAWLPSGDTQFKLADFSPLTSVGDYRIDVEGIDSPFSFSVGDGLYSEARQAALRYYYLNRAGMAVEERFDDKWQRRKGHADENVAKLAKFVDAVYNYSANSLSYR